MPPLCRALGILRSGRGAEAPSSRYRWGDEEVDFHYCPICACVTHYLTTEKCGVSRVALNARMLSEEMLAGIPRREVDGASF